MEHWYALYTKPRHEKKVFEQLEQKNIVSYLPLHKILKQWSDRKKWVEEPLFKSYVFVQGDNQIRYHALQSHGAVNFLSFNGKPSPVYEWEIDTIKRILKDASDVEPCNPYHIGDAVKVKHGPLIGLSGRLIEIQGTRKLIVMIDSIKQALRFKIDIQDVGPA